MDDARTPTSTWLTFSLAFPDSTRLCRHLRKAQPDPRFAGATIERYLARQDDELATTLQDELKAGQLTQLFSPQTQRRHDLAMEWLAQSAHHHLLGLDHPAYPSLLSNTEDAPPLLYAKGSLDALQHPLVAAVGSRKASHQSLAHTRSLCQELSQHGIGVVSGLALGIDAAAHEGALAGSNAPTIAIAATSPDRVYPRRHAALEDRIINSGGLILTEYPLGSVTRPWFFPQRNRIISGVSHAVLIAEAALPSGTMTTAVHAMNQGREVMAVPGSIHKNQARGCHALIKQGAALVENLQDVLDVLGDPVMRILAEAGGPQAALPLSDGYVSRNCDRSTQPTPGNNLSMVISAQERDLLRCLSAQPASVDELMTQTQLSISHLTSLLGEMEVKGLVINTKGAKYNLCESALKTANYETALTKR